MKYKLLDFKNQVVTEIHSLPFEKVPQAIVYGGRVFIIQSLSHDCLFWEVHSIFAGDDRKSEDPRIDLNRGRQ